LNLWLSTSNTASQLGKVYKPVLVQLVEGHKGCETPLDLALGSLVMLRYSLPTQALATLLNVKEDEMIFIVQRLHAVLRQPKDPMLSIEILHDSFRKYLLGEDVTRECEIQIDQDATHKKLFLECLECIRNNGSLKKSASLSDLATKYACTSWVHHLQASGIEVTTDDDVCRFLQKDTIKWLRSSKAVGELFVVPSLIAKLQRTKAGFGSVLAASRVGNLHFQGYSGGQTAV